MKVFVRSGEVLETTINHGIRWDGVRNFPFLYEGEGTVFLCTLAADGESPAPLDVYGTGGVGGHNATHTWSTPTSGWNYPIPNVTYFRWYGGEYGFLRPGINYVDISLHTESFETKVGIAQDIWLVGEGVRPVNKIDVGVPVQQFQIGLMPGT